MKNKELNPFSILCDSYADEAAQFYDKLIRKVEFGIRNTNTIGQTKRRLLKCAFAYLCMDYIHEVADIYPNEDIPLFIEEMHLENHLPAIYYIMGQEGIKWEIDTFPKASEIDEELFFELMQDYKRWWGRRIKKAYPLGTNFYDLFADNIFGEHAPTGIDAASKAMNFIDDLIK